MKIDFFLFFFGGGGGGGGGGQGGCELRSESFVSENSKKNGGVRLVGGQVGGGGLGGGFRVDVNGEVKLL